ncbi:MAG: alkylhydroperoxidase/carboxymuconolactone decarboxylase family protein YurZ [Candidatus Paceibacteria bacterium]|jgi:alkylhydroperoxidase/carboxymuconolactone decarboxylase family protein YurZ
MTLTDKDKVLIRLSTAVVVGNWDEVKALRLGAEPDREWRETVLQTHLFAGFPRLVQAFGVLDGVGGLGQPGADELEDGALQQARGKELFDTIYGDGAGTVRDMLHGYHADFGAWIAEHAYSRVLARPGVTADRRELQAACALAALGQERQLASHARGSLRCGASFEELMQALETAGDLMQNERLERAKRIAERFREQ